MGKQRKRHRLPYWIRSQNFRLLNNSEKDFLGYLYSFGPDTCWLWNWRLQKKFHRCRRTVQYWLAKLKELGFIWIEKPYGPERKIHTRLIPSPEHWVKLMATMALPRKPAKPRQRRKSSRGRIRPIYPGASEALIEQTRHDIINELVHRGETFETAEKVANQFIERNRQKADKKKGIRECKKLHP